MKGKLSDQTDELENLKLRMKKIETYEKNSQTEVTCSSLADELKLSNDNQENEELKKEFESMKRKLEKVEKNQVEKKSLLKHLDDLSKNKIEALIKLKEGIDNIGKKRKPKCRFGWNCKRLFCSYNNSHLHTIVNTYEKKEHLVETLNL